MMNSISKIDDEKEVWSDAHSNFLSSLSKIETADLLKCSRRRVLKARAHLFRAGDQSSDVYIVANGCIRLFQVASSGKETILWFSFPGEIFGIAELCQGNDRQIHAIANDDTQLYCISHKDFTRFLGTHPEAAMKAIGILSARVRTFGHALVGLSSDNVETRIARLLVRFAAISSGERCSASSTNEELCVRVRLTHQDIANLIGASRQTVTTTLAHLRKQGAVRMVNQHIHIMKPDRLQLLLDANATKVAS